MATPAMEFKPQLTRGIAMAGLVSAGMGLLQYAQVSDELAPWVNASPGGDVYANCGRGISWRVCW
ncbi:MAG: hypothetical protein HC765_01095 [Brachymonas sp.]|nr:hypothetical protein [Brachymonas sp.]